MKLKNLTAAFALLGLTVSASAITWVDRDPDSGNGPLDFLYESYPNDGVGSDYTYYGNFNIAQDGYNQSKHEITGIWADFAFSDDNLNQGDYGNDRDWREEVDIYMGSNSVLGEVKIANDLEVDGSNSSYDWHSFDLSSNAKILGDLQNGYINYRIRLDPNYSDWHKGREDTYLRIAKIEVHGREVPDSGTTLSLLAFTLLGFVGLKRRLKN